MLQRKANYTHVYKSLMKALYTLLMMASLTYAGTITFDYDPLTNTTSIAVSDPSRMQIACNCSNNSAVNIFAPTPWSGEAFLSPLGNASFMRLDAGGTVFVEIAYEEFPISPGQLEVSIQMWAEPGTCAMAFPHGCINNWSGDLSDQVEWFDGSTLTFDTVFFHVGSAGSVNAEAAIPEPGAAVLVGMGLIGLRLRRSWKSLLLIAAVPAAVVAILWIWLTDRNWRKTLLDH